MPCALLVQCRLEQPLWKEVWRYLKKLKVDLPFDPEIPLLRIYQKELKQEKKEHNHLYVHCSIICNHQDMEGAQVSINK